MNRYRGLFRVLAILFVLALALNLRLRAVERLPIDYDEDDYLGAAQRYAAFLRAGDWAGLINYDYNYEHPPLTKIVYALAIVRLPPAPLTATPAPSKPIPTPMDAAAETTLMVALEMDTPPSSFF